MLLKESDSRTIFRHIYAQKERYIETDRQTQTDRETDRQTERRRRKPFDVTEYQTKDYLLVMAFCNK